jgi:RNA polymerase sigma-70 factor (ECF subfamily)
LTFDIRRFHAGDEAVFTELVTTWSPRLVPYGRRYAEGEDVHDRLQDVWLRAYTRRMSFAGRGSIFGWLLAICRTVGVDSVRRSAREPSAEGLSDVEAQPGVDDIEARLVRAELRDAVMALPERQRDVVLLRLVEGTSSADTARLLKCAEGTVKATLHQAVRTLRERLKETIP